MRKLTIALGPVCAFLLGCSVESPRSTLKAPPLRIAEAQEELNTIASKVKGLYGPLDFKQERFGFKFDDAVKDASAEISAAKNDGEIGAAYAKLLMKFRDGHVGIRFRGNNTDIKAYKLGMFLVPIEKRAIVADVQPSLSEQGVLVGDELLSMDGEKPMDLLPTLKKYTAFGNDLSDEHSIAYLTNRKFYMTELLPKTPIATLRMQHADGTNYEVKVAWQVSKEDTAAVDLATGPKNANFIFTGFSDMKDMGQGSLMEMGQYRPYFASDEVKKALGLVEVQPSDEFLKKYGVDREKLKDEAGEAIYAAIYNYKGKRILLVRQPGYYPEQLKVEDLLNGYRAILDQYDDIVDMLVIDQTHNPGGSLDYAQQFFGLFVNKPSLNLVQQMHADRDWIYGLNDWAKEVEKTDPGFASALRARSELVDQALTAGKRVSDPMPIIGFEYVQPDKKYTWKKPILVLADELAGSCGDIFPMYMQRNGVAKIFGERTMGLGGNVEEVISLPYSSATVRLTRGLFTTYRPDSSYTKDDLIENNGITPDYHSPVTVEDFRGGFVKYATAFSDIAAGM
jgi:hypothetical protein